MSGQKHKSTYEIVVAADSAEEAIAVAAEALPRDAAVVASQADATDGDTGASWRVRLSYTGGARRTNDPAA